MNVHFVSGTATYLSDKEKEICRQASEVLARMQYQMETQNVEHMMSPVTGECIVRTNVPLMRGVLSAMAEQPLWYIEQ